MVSVTSFVNAPKVVNMLLSLATQAVESRFVMLIICPTICKTRFPERWYITIVPDPCHSSEIIHELL